MAITLSQVVKKYVTGNANQGARGLELCLVSVRHAFQHGDTTPLAWLIAKSEGKDSDLFRSIAGKVMGGVTMKKDATQPSGLKITLGENAAPTASITILENLVADKVSFRSDRVKEELLARTPTTKDFDLDKVTKAFVKKLHKEGVTFNSMMRALSSLKDELSA